MRIHRLGWTLADVCSYPNGCPILGPTMTYVVVAKAAAKGDQYIIASIFLTTSPLQLHRALLCLDLLVPSRTGRQPRPLFWTSSIRGASSAGARMLVHTPKYSI